ncbi:hypothetical protein ABB37_01434 [Leptomonas pyrrhocoris]|uniref:Uncharacterized protein n=1 Tax=Leptomonas pyrrhocoris TaxID=157538 RepID=A0A0N0DZB5_LEPPY|nr:hypothetical protein ABB37_01434 [Leptomonas pyrrhocoris]XP_015663441.1 hypothetical protein ABB37_01434 [Leptomonas pyrrhocoris]KPA85001.1 hypothetical protein ABB37_01434 [Leptomonas pyrrhocoris]KPA85002.1 hypothetical protein ABB37_01434 [Leptomonas pyrrhocoris]|eukprot:XP_015663440.1 hypothetical protein ABB37_01434 [Leptomonas pyrrhocoris]
MSSRIHVAATAIAKALSSTADDDDAKQQLLSGSQFFLLCFLVAVSYYVSLFISAHAAGESVASLGAPVAAASRMLSDVGTTIMRSINRRRNNTQPGAVSYEEVDENDDLFLGVNQPAAGAQS